MLESLDVINWVIVIQIVTQDSKFEMCANHLNIMISFCDLTKISVHGIFIHTEFNKTRKQRPEAHLIL